MAGLSLSSALSLGLSPRGGGTPTPPPTPLSAPAAAFNVAPLNTITVSRTFAGAITHDYDHTAARAALSPIVTYWVDSTTGNNANAGTEVSPFRGGSKALAMVLASGGLGCIKVKGAAVGQPRVKYLSTATQTDGTTSYADSFNGTYTDLEVIIEPWNTGEVWDSVIAQAGVTWTSTADGNIYKNATATAIACDYANLDDYANARRLARLDLTAGTTEANAIIAINALWATYSGITDASGSGYALGVICRVASGSTYIRTFNNRAPDADLQLVSDSGANLTILASTKAPRLFQTGAGYVGGSALGCVRVSGTGGFRPLVNQAGCRFVAGGTGGSGIGAFSALGTSDSQGCDVISLRCSINGASLDGFNYHNLCRYVEISCAGDWSGWSTNLTNNGTTAHEVTIGMSINGRYLNNQDRSVHHVGDSKTWMLKCVSSTRRGSDASPQSTPWASGIDGVAGTSAIYMDTCRYINGVNGAPQYVSEANHANSRIYYANLDFTPIVGPAAVPGQVLPYTP